MLSHSFAALRTWTDFRATSTTTRSAPTLRNAIVRDAGATSTTRAGETESATGARITGRPR